MEIRCIIEYMLDVDFVILGLFTAQYKSWLMLKILKIERKVESFHSLYETRSWQYNNEIHNVIILSYSVVLLYESRGLISILYWKTGV